MMNVENVIAYEKSLIANLLKNNDLLQKLALKPHMFYAIEHQEFIKFVQEKNRISLNEISNETRRNEHFMNDGELGYLVNSDLTDRVFFREEQVNILNGYKDREVKKAFAQYQMDEIDINELNKAVEDINSLTIEAEDEKKNYINEVIDEIMGEKVEKFQTGIKSIDKKIGAFEPGQMNVIAARPSVGKTALTLEMMIRLAKSGVETTFFSLETSGKNVIQRLTANLSGVELQKFKHTELLDIEDIDNIMKVLGVIDKLPINIVYNAMTTTEDVRMQALKQNERQQVIFVDYIQIMKAVTPNPTSRRMEVEQISRDLKTIATETGAIIIIVAQLNRGAENRSDKRPMISDIKESGSIEQDANMIFMLYREDYYDDELVDTVNGISVVECNIAKNKDGEGGVIKLDYHKKTQRFYSHDYFGAND